MNLKINILKDDFVIFYLFYNYNELTIFFLFYKTARDNKDMLKLAKSNLMHEFKEVTSF